MTGCGIIARDDSEQIGMQLRTTCEGDCKCIMEIIGEGNQSTGHHEVNLKQPDVSR